MKHILLITVACLAATTAAIVPAVIGLTGNESSGRPLPIRVHHNVRVATGVTADNQRTAEEFRSANSADDPDRDHGSADVDPGRARGSSDAERRDENARADGDRDSADARASDRRDSERAGDNGDGRDARERAGRTGDDGQANGDESEHGEDGQPDSGGDG